MANKLPEKSCDENYASHDQFKRGLRLTNVEINELYLRIGNLEQVRKDNYESYRRIEQTKIDFKKQIMTLEYHLSWAINCLPASDWKDDMPLAFKKLKEAREYLRFPKKR